MVHLPATVSNPIVSPVYLVLFTTFKFRSDLRAARLQISLSRTRVARRDKMLRIATRICERSREITIVLKGIKRLNTGRPGTWYCIRERRDGRKRSWNVNVKYKYVRRRLRVEDPKGKKLFWLTLDIRHPACLCYAVSSRSSPFLRQVYFLSLKLYIVGDRTAKKTRRSEWYSVGKTCVRARWRGLQSAQVFRAGDV